MKSAKFTILSIPFAGLLVVVVCLSLSALSCVNNNPVDPSDPNVKPIVLSTFPQNGGIGPFYICTPKDSGLGHFYIHFNKLMDTYSFSNKSIACDGFGKAVSIRPLFSSTYSYSRYEDIVPFGIFDTLGIRVPYEIGKQYTITIDTTSVDVNNNHLSRSFSFSFTPEPQFRVIGVSPASGDTLTFGNGFDLFFNSPIDETTLQYFSFTPAAQGGWYLYDYLGKAYGAHCWCEDFHANRSYVFQIAKGAKDKAGRMLSNQYTAQFHAGAFSLVDLHKYFYQLNGFIYIRFSAPVDTNSVHQAFSITPVTPGRFIWFTYGDGFNFYPANDWIPSTQYTVTLSTELKDLDGNSLATSVVDTVTSTTFHYEYYYFDSYNGAYHYQILRLHFSGRVDTGTVRPGFKIIPAVSGNLGLGYGSDEIALQSTNGFLPSTNYKVNLSKAIHSISGYELAYPDSFVFSTPAAR
jgi:hypothetical protein